MSLASERAAIRAGVTNSRTSSGAAERRATGQRIVAERRGESVVEDLNRLQRPARTVRTLRSVPAVGGVPALRGRGSYVAPPPATGGGGIASPLTETNYALREFHDSRYFTTVDGIFVWQIDPPKKFVMEDANGATVEQIFAEPA
ncbi:MAG: hypothetical protein KJ989_07325 [Gammaproteobacteria bacterium]|uniref:Uncharacterized protein n=1 Tax=viral metagenome TaxID=1070528 RepID=A0A6M3KDM6_9ZZZZ|nr:hypothetical protein [Gammaproteobacteria bacterium]MBU2067467.1 hypothetical protein [Gammaproteobacteria bacterium]MBU2139477.1 hypothetical protein [Gammaproteobacteria bacterium]MBU2255904.1 hypothetical protein [Gammaproteobacteria bacterium]MBU2294000.1 hypothetical protein [Gammaproteobacteria bacterium]